METIAIISAALVITNATIYFLVGLLFREIEKVKLFFGIRDNVDEKELPTKLRVLHIFSIIGICFQILAFLKLISGLRIFAEII